MRVDYGMLAIASHISLGVGGETRNLVEQAVLVFDDRANLSVYETEITISRPEPDPYAMPSLLGRSVLDRWNLTYRPSRAILAVLRVLEILVVGGWFAKRLGLGVR